MKFIIFLAVLAIIANCQFTYDETLSKKLAGFAFQSYCTNHNIPLNNCGAPCQENPQGLIDFIDIHDQEYNARAIAGYSRDNNAIIFSFRGTVDITNWITNFSFLKVEYPDCADYGCQVHSDYYYHYESMKQQIATSFAILRIKYPFAKIYVTGHSLGAAIATLALPQLYILNGNRQIDAFYNFSSPRVGNQEFSSWIKESEFAVQFARITHGKDPVVQNPSSSFPLSFVHTHNEVYYPDFSQSNNTYQLCAEAEDSSCGVQSHYFAFDVNHHILIFGWDTSSEVKQCEY